MDQMLHLKWMSLTKLKFQNIVLELFVYTWNTCPIICRLNLIQKVYLNHLNPINVN